MNASHKLQRAARTFLLRLVAESGPTEAARILRQMADELDELVRENLDIANDRPPHRPNG